MRSIRWGIGMSNLTDEEKERIALMVEHLPPDEAQEAYERRCETMRQWKRRSVGKKSHNRSEGEVSDRLS